MFKHLAVSMQAVIRQAVGDFTRGISTGLVVYAGSRCPDCTCTCPAVTLTCPAVNSVEVCSGVPVVIVIIYVTLSFGAGVILAVVVGFGVGRGTSNGKGPHSRGRFAALNDL